MFDIVLMLDNIFARDPFGVFNFISHIEHLFVRTGSIDESGV